MFYLGHTDSSTFTWLMINLVRKHLDAWKRSEEELLATIQAEHKALAGTIDAADVRAYFYHSYPLARICRLISQKAAMEISVTVKELYVAQLEVVKTFEAQVEGLCTPLLLRL